MEIRRGGGGEHLAWVQIYGKVYGKGIKKSKNKSMETTF